MPRNLIRMAQSFNVPFHAIVTRVIWPGALLDPCRISHHGLGGVAAGGERGNDRRPVRHWRFRAAGRKSGCRPDQLLAGVVILSLFGLAVGKLINLLEARLLHWR